MRILTIEQFYRWYRNLSYDDKIEEIIVKGDEEGTITLESIHKGLRDIESKVMPLVKERDRLLLVATEFYVKGKID